MSNFNDRQKAYEDKFAHDEEKMFKARAKAAKLLGQWVAENAGLPTDSYESELVNHVINGGSEQSLFEKVKSDAQNKGKPLSSDVIAEKFNQFLAQVKEQIAKG
jgi:hypothetical protein